MIRSTLLAAVAALGLAGSGCGALNDQSMAVFGAHTKSYDETSMKCTLKLPPPGMMSVGMLPDVVFTAGGTFDVGVAAALGVGFNMRILAGNKTATRMSSGSSPVELNNIFMTGLEYEYVAAASDPLSVFFRGTLAKRTENFGGPQLPPGGFLSMQIAAIDPITTKQLESAMVLPQGIDPETPLSELIIRIRARGNSGGVAVFSNWFEFPVRVCSWCLGFNPAEPGTSAIKSGKVVPCPAEGPAFEYPCSNGPAQDGPVACCAKGNTVVCGPGVPSM